MKFIPIHPISNDILLSSIIGGVTTVITIYELNETKHTIRTVDQKAFVNIMQTMEVMGRFRRD
ncbi:DUF2179 domain-containing protein [Bacillus sp. ISL-75]|nr:DUF2179 domain-containing protein [Bacillus sp. ISL-75]